MVKNGDLNKMTLLFDRYNKTLFGFFFHMSGRRDVSEDMLQTVFYRMLKYRQTFHGKGEFKSWMYFLAYNVFKDETKKNKRHQSQQDLSEYEDRIEYGVQADDSIQKEQDMIMLRNAMKSLKHDEREILVLSQFQKLPYQEISLILGISEGAVKVRVHRAFAQLKIIYLKTASYALR